MQSRVFAFGSDTHLTVCHRVHEIVKTVFHDVKARICAPCCTSVGAREENGVNRGQTLADTHSHQKEPERGMKIAVFALMM